MNKSLSSYIKHIIHGFRNHTLFYLALAVVTILALLFLTGRDSGATLYVIFLDDPAAAVIIVLSTLCITFFMNYFIWRFRKR
jgi:hypothetical protein